MVLLSSYGSGHINQWFRAHNGLTSCYEWYKIKSYIERKKIGIMILSIARQSVMIKCNLQASIMTGNYEFYYAAGVLHKLVGIELADVLEPMELSKQVHKLIEDFKTEDTREQHLVRMLKYYKPISDFDDQMKELFLLGTEEKNIWQELLPEI